MQYLIKNNCIVSVYNAFTIPIMILFLQEIGYNKHLNNNIQYTILKIIVGENMDKDFVDNKIKRITKNLDDGLVKQKLRECKLERTLLDYVTNDIVDSYDKLIAQRKECVDKFINYYKIFLSNDEDVDIVDIYKQISYKLNQEIDYWNLEIKPMKDLKKASDEFTDDEYEQELRDFLDSNKIF